MPISGCLSLGMVDVSIDDIVIVYQVFQYSWSKVTLAMRQIDRKQINGQTDRQAADKLADRLTD